MKQITLMCAAILWVTAAASGWSQSRPEDHFRIHVVDGATGRGIPLVELETVNQVLYVTDSAGMAAIHEPGLMDRRVFFHVRSHGYEFVKDGFGFRGIRPKLEPGGSIRVEMKRVNIAERLFRVTGQGIYRDSVLLGDKVPIAEPLLNGGVFGQDSVVNALYKGRLYWFWGDTNRASYPLGNFSVSGAVSELPKQGGLEPDQGVNLSYFVNEKGFSRKMCPIEGPGPVWIGGLMVLEHKGRERLLCHYARMKNLDTRLEHGIALWSDEKELFEKVCEFPPDAPLHPRGHTLRVRQGAEDWFYFPDPFPAVRVRARLGDILDPGRYEGYTCLEEGLRWREADPPLDRDAEGRLKWSWKSNTSFITPVQWATLLNKKLVKPGEGWHDLVDVETASPVVAHRGSVCWNEFKGKWVMIFVEAGGRSFLGEVWYAESKNLEGSWNRVRRIVTHDRYSFYNVKQHPYFDGEEGRFVFFEGTYTSTFSGNSDKTPRYDYNQIMYRLDLGDPRLDLDQ